MVDGNPALGGVIYSQDTRLSMSSAHDSIPATLWGSIEAPFVERIYPKNSLEAMEGCCQWRPHGHGGRLRG